MSIGSRRNLIRQSNAALYVPAGGGGGGVTGTGWGDAGTNYLSFTTTAITNDTAEHTNIGSWAVAKSTTGHASGAFYGEVKIINTTGNRAMFGVIDSATSGGSALNSYFAVVVNSAGIDSAAAGYANGADFSATSATSYTVNNTDIFGICYNAGKVWITRNGTSILGNPVAGTGEPIDVVGSHTVHMAAVLLPSSSSPGDIIQIINGSAALTFLPSGYTAWG